MSSEPTKMSTFLRSVGTIAAGVAGAVFFIWPLGTWALVRNLDTPRYKIIKPLSTKKSWLHSGYVAEVRQYEPYIIAEVDISKGSDIDTALSNGFKQVAEYIFGGNEKDGAVEKVAMTAPVGLEGASKGKRTGEKIAMTAPVSAEIQDDQYRVWFMMPFKYTSISQLPRPKNDAVHFRQVPSQTLAALTFSGPGPREPEVAAKRAELEALLAAAGVEVEEGADVKLWQYHPPFAPPWQRRNEVLLPVKGGAVGVE